MFETIVYIAAATLTALLAGVFFGYSVSVNGALHRLNDIEYIKAMQAINKVIRNSLFFLTFMGPVFLLPLAAYLSYGDGVQFVAWLVASIAYILGTFGITMGGNEPLNERIARFDIDSSDPKAAATARQAFEMPWNRLHNWRTILAILATVLVIWALAS